MADDSSSPPYKKEKKTETKQEVQTYDILLNSYYYRSPLRKELDIDWLGQLKEAYIILNTYSAFGYFGAVEKVLVNGKEAEAGRLIGAPRVYCTNLINRGKNTFEIYFRQNPVPFLPSGWGRWQLVVISEYTVEYEILITPPSPTLESIEKKPEEQKQVEGKKEDTGCAELPADWAAFGTHVLDGRHASHSTPYASISISIVPTHLDTNGQFVKWDVSVDAWIWGGKCFGSTIYYTAYYDYEYPSMVAHSEMERKHITKIEGENVFTYRKTVISDEWGYMVQIAYERLHEGRGPTVPLILPGISLHNSIGREGLIEVARAFQIRTLWKRYAKNKFDGWIPIDEAKKVAGLNEPTFIKYLVYKYGYEEASRILEISVDEIKYILEVTKPYQQSLPP